MKITLINFRCHNNAVFEIPDEGLVLLSGESGVGKTTILNAISYAMYGNLKKPYSHGKTSCKVILEIKGLVITRTNKPNILVVTHNNVKYEDDAGQDVIDRFFNMNYKEFMASSYVVQSLHNSVVSMTPLEQISFIEKLAFDGDIHYEYKNKIKEVIKSAKIELSGVNGKLDTINSQIIKYESELENIDIDELRELDIDNIKEESSMVVSESKKVKQNITSLEKELKELENIEKHNKSLNQQIYKLETEKNQLIKFKDELGDIYEEDYINKYKKDVEDMKNELQKIKSYERYTILKQKINKYNLENKNIIKEKLDKLNQELIPDDEIENIRNEIENADQHKIDYEKSVSESVVIQKLIDDANIGVKKIFEDIKSLFSGNSINRIKKNTSLLTFLKKQVNNYNIDIQNIENEIKDIEKKLSINNLISKTYDCPKCSTKLILKDEGLIIPEENLELVESEDILQGKLSQNKTKLEKLKNIKLKVDGMISELQKFIEDLNKIPPKIIEFDYNRIIELKNRLNIHDNTTNEILKIKNNQDNDNTMIKDLKNERNILLKIIGNKNYKPPTTKFNMEDKINDKLDEIKIMWKNRGDYHTFIRGIKNCEKEIKELENNKVKKNILNKNHKNVEDIKLELEDEHKKYNEYSERLQKLVELSQKISLYNTYEMISDNLYELEDKKQSYLDDKKRIENRLEGAIGMEIVCKEAEIIAMEKTIQTINELASMYLNDLFDDNIIVKLRNIKNNKGGTQLNTYVEYKGSEYSSIDEFSGGELQRIELSFLLAVNDMVGSNMILLDECLNNLDAGINMEVLNHLKELSKGKLILVVSHEAVNGIFDNIVDVLKGV